MCVVKAKSHDRRPRVPPGGFSVQTRGNVPVCFKVSCTGSPLSLFISANKVGNLQSESCGEEKKRTPMQRSVPFFFSRTTKHALWVRNSRGASVAFSWFQYPQYRLIHQHGIKMWCYRRSSSDALFFSYQSSRPRFCHFLDGTQVHAASKRLSRLQTTTEMRL